MGVPTGAYFVIEELTARLKKVINPRTKILVSDMIYIVLRKLKLNEAFTALGNDFGISKQYVSKIFSKTLPEMAFLLKELNIWPSNDSIEAHLPLQFRNEFTRVKCIIDCFEIEIQQPNNPLHQAVTWSDYKSTNTIKYLIGVTPDGLICYISEGFGGRTTDQQITKTCDFLEKIPAGSTVMADRGFKELATKLAKRNCHLIRPCSIENKTPMTKENVILSRKIASARIHVERVISRIREFAFLRMHSVVHHDMLCHLNEAVICACALINLQKPIIS